LPPVYPDGGWRARSVPPGFRTRLQSSRGVHFGVCTNVPGTQLSEYCIRYHPKTSIIVTTSTGYPGTWVQTGTRKPVRNYPRGACLSRWVSKVIGGTEGVRGVHSRSADGRETQNYQVPQGYVLVLVD
jgi:hypothetical protein